MERARSQVRDAKREEQDSKALPKIALSTGRQLARCLPLPEDSSLLPARGGPSTRLHWRLGASCMRTDPAISFHFKWAAKQCETGRLNALSLPEWTTFRLRRPPSYLIRTDAGSWVETIDDRLTPLNPDLQSPDEELARLTLQQAQQQQLGGTAAAAAAAAAAPPPQHEAESPPYPPGERGGGGETPGCRAPVWHTPPLFEVHAPACRTPLPAVRLRATQPV